MPRGVQQFNKKGKPAARPISPGFLICLRGQPPSAAPCTRPAASSAFAGPPARPAPKKGPCSGCSPETGPVGGDASLTWHPPCKTKQAGLRQSESSPATTTLERLYVPSALAGYYTTRKRSCQIGEADFLHWPPACVTVFPGTTCRGVVHRRLQPPLPAEGGSRPGLLAPGSGRTARILFSPPGPPQAGREGRKERRGGSRHGTPAYKAGSRPAFGGQRPMKWA